MLRWRRRLPRQVRHLIHVRGARCGHLTFESLAKAWAKPLLQSGPHGFAAGAAKCQRKSFQILVEVETREVSLLPIYETLLRLSDPGEEPNTPFHAFGLSQILETLQPLHMHIQQVWIVRQSQQDVVVVAYHRARILPGQFPSHSVDLICEEKERQATATDPTMLLTTPICSIDIDSSDYA